MSKTWCVAFCGAGGIVAGNHLPALEKKPERYVVAGFFDLVAEKARKMAGTAYQAYGTYEALLADSRVDVVVVATKPLSTHFPAARQALLAGKHVVLEKPMASTAAECDELIRIAREQKLLLTVHHNRRLDLDFLALQEVLVKGKIGEPRLVVTAVGGGYQPGDFVDWGVHLVDQALLVNPSALVEVSALLAHPHLGVEQGGFGEATLRFVEPPVVRVAMLPRAKEFLLNGTAPAVRFYAAGTGGTFVQRIIEDPRDLMNATQNFDNLRPEYAVPPYLTITRRDYYDFLYDSLCGQAPLLVKPEQARNAIRVIELISESARANRTVQATDILEVNT